MWIEGKRTRFRTLRQQEIEGTLTESEQAELAQMIAELEAEEASYLKPATQRIREERLHLQSQNAALKSVIKRQERLARRLERTLATLRSERQQIERELTTILGPGVGQHVNASE
jgi:hypothetical protein